MNHEILFTGKRLDTGQWVHGSLVQMLVDGRIASCIATIKEAGRTNNDVPPMGILFTLNKDIFLVDPDTVGPYAGPIGKIPAEQRQSEELEEEITMLPSNENYLSEQKISEFVDRKFFRCVGEFLSWLRLGETYWFEYIGNDHYTVRSDNNLGKNFEMTQHQLLTKFFPVNCETDKLYAMKYCHRLGELGIHKGYIDDIYNAYCKFQSEQPREDLEEEIKRKYKSDIALMMPIKDFRKLIHYFTDWQKEQMMKSAFDGEITKFFDGNLSVKAQLPKGSKCCFGDKVKVIIIKEGKQ